MQDKVVIVTGGSRGIGASIVKTLARKGYKLNKLTLGFVI